MLITTHIDTPVGKMIAAATEEGICLFDFEYRSSIDSIMRRIETGISVNTVAGDHLYFNILKLQLEEYFAGGRKEFDVPLHLVGSPFQVDVWRALQQIPYGEVRSYMQQAEALGNVKAIRAVAGANGDNGIAIIIPCHRVIGTNGSLTGYGGGLARKKWLLDHEMKHSGKHVQMSLGF